MAINHASKLNVGIDAGKARLDAHIYERNIAFSVSNDPPGIWPAHPGASRGENMLRWLTWVHSRFLYASIKLPPTPYYKLLRLL